MPEFISNHTPVDVDLICQGYLTAVEWLLDDSIDRDKIRGFSRQTKTAAIEDCRRFATVHAIDIARYIELRTDELAGREYSPEECVGHDLYLSRNGHGVGFSDRGDDPVFDRLQAAAEQFKEVYHYVERGWIKED